MALLLPTLLDPWLEDVPTEELPPTLVVPVALLPPADADAALLLPPGRLVAVEDPGALLDRPDDTTPEEDAPAAELPAPEADDDTPPLLVVTPASAGSPPVTHTPLATSHASPPGQGLLMLHTRWQLPATHVKPPSQSGASWHW